MSQHYAASSQGQLSHHSSTSDYVPYSSSKQSYLPQDIYGHPPPPSSSSSASLSSHSSHSLPFPPYLPLLPSSSSSQTLPPPPPPRAPFVSPYPYQRPSSSVFWKRVNEKIDDLNRDIYSIDGQGSPAQNLQNAIEKLAKKIVEVEDFYQELQGLYHHQHHHQQYNALSDGRQGMYEKTSAPSNRRPSDFDPSHPRRQRSNYRPYQQYARRHESRVDTHHVARPHEQDHSYETSSSDPRRPTYETSSDNRQAPSYARRRYDQDDEERGERRRSRRSPHHDRRPRRSTERHISQNNTSERSGRSERGDRSEKNERGGRSERGNRSEKSEKGERHEQSTECKQDNLDTSEINDAELGEFISNLIEQPSLLHENLHGSSTKDPPKRVDSNDSNQLLSRLTDGLMPFDAAALEQQHNSNNVNKTGDLTPVEPYSPTQPKQTDTADFFQDSNDAGHSIDMDDQY